MILEIFIFANSLFLNEFIEEIQSKTLPLSHLFAKIAQYFEGE